MALESNVSIFILFFMFRRFNIPIVLKNTFLHVSYMFHIGLLHASYKFLSMFLPCFYHVFHRFLF
jgi:hypothetical protein